MNDIYTNKLYDLIILKNLFTIKSLNFTNINFNLIFI
jgi:hypothetical protein